jgi:integration host factor subunit beta
MPPHDPFRTHRPDHRPLGGAHRQDVETAVKAIFEGMTETLANGERIEIRGFGSFRLTYRPPRIGRNPLTGDTVPVPAKAVPHFKAGRELAARVNSDKGSQVPDG